MRIIMRIGSEDAPAEKGNVDASVLSTGRIRMRTGPEAKMIVIGITLLITMTRMRRKKSLRADRILNSE